MHAVRMGARRITTGHPRRRAAWLVGALWSALALSLAPPLVTTAPSTRPVGVRAAAATAPAAATVVVDRGKLAFSPGTITLAGGGTLTLVNLDTFDHTVTSVATNEEGTPLFDLRVAAGTSATITGVETLVEGSYAFFCKLHLRCAGRSSSRAARAQ